MVELTGFLLGSGCRGCREKDGGGEEEERRRDGETWTHHVVVCSSLLRLRLCCLQCVCRLVCCRSSELMSVFAF
jgi:hypothetical protein